VPSVDAAGIVEVGGLRAPQAAQLQVAESVEQPAALEIDRERRGIVCCGPWGLGVPLLVELPQLGQLPQELFDRPRVSTLILMSCQDQTPNFRGPLGSSQGDPG
jgi:hypothetical protein